MSRISPKIREEVRRRAGERCEYCRFPENLVYFSHQIDHIIPHGHGGSDRLINLAWACFRCNNNKGTNIATVDIPSGQKVWLFNPREQEWDAYFEVDDAGIILGKTPEGRATVRLLDMNHAEYVSWRRYLMKKNRW